MTRCPHRARLNELRGSLAHVAGASNGGLQARQDAIALTIGIAPMADTFTH